MNNQAISPAVDSDHLTAGYWRERFDRLRTQIEGQKDLADLLEKEDAKTFGGMAGYRRADNVLRGIAGRDLTRQVVEILERVRPLKTTPARLGRQNLKQAS